MSPRIKSVFRIKEAQARRMFADTWDDKNPSGPLYEFALGHLTDAGVDLLYKELSSTLWCYLCSLSREEVAARWHRRIDFLKRHKEIFVKV